jgi:type I restriction-modification system DNA methylase subunit
MSGKTINMEAVEMKTEMERDLEETISAFKSIEEINSSINALKDTVQRIRLELQDKLGVDYQELERRFRKAKDEGRF